MLPCSFQGSLPLLHTIDRIINAEANTDFLNIIDSALADVAPHGKISVLFKAITKTHTDIGIGTDYLNQRLKQKKALSRYAGGLERLLARL